MPWMFAPATSPMRRGETLAEYRSNPSQAVDLRILLRELTNLISIRVRQDGMPPTIGLDSVPALAAF
jgi:hypothetical protein